MRELTVTTTGDIVAYTNERNFFKSVSNDTLMRNYKKYNEYLSDNDKRAQFENLRVGLELCTQEMKERGIDLPQNL